MQDTDEKAKKGKRGAYHHGDLRAGLVEATRALVEEKGPDHFSVAEACREAGVSTAAPYKHFKDKDEMLLQLLAQEEQLLYYKAKTRPTFFGLSYQNLALIAGAVAVPLIGFSLHSRSRRVKAE